MTGDNVGVTPDPFRRRFLRCSVAAAIAFPALGLAQTPGGMRRVALLLASNPAATSQWSRALVGGLAELGWVEGRNLHLDFRYAETDASRYRPLAAELLDLKPDLFVAGFEPIAREAVALTKTLPIVFAIGFDPVGNGLVKSFARPGGNVTGISILSYELMPKRLALLKEAVPDLTRVAVLYRTGDVNAARAIKLLAEPAKKLGLAMIQAEVGDAAGLERAFEHLARQKVDGFMVVADVLFFQHAARIFELAIKHRMASGFGAVEGGKAGALLSYSPDFIAVYRRLATLIDKILKGARPAEIPVEQLNVYELVVNLKTARALGIKLPPSFLLQATQTIE